MKLFRLENQGDEALKTQTLDSGIENVAYTAPEVYMEGAYSTKSDIYSVGFVIWELAMRIITGRPYLIKWYNIYSSLQNSPAALKAEHQTPYEDLVKAGQNSFQILRKTCMTGLR